MTPDWWFFVSVLARTLPIGIAPNPDDVDSFNNVKSRMITEFLSKEISRNNCSFRFASEVISEHYFHMNRSETTVHIIRAEISVPKCIHIKTVANDIFSLRMDISLMLPSLMITGRIKVRQNTQLEAIDNEDGPFSLAIKNVTGAGICFTKWTDIDYKVIDCDLHCERTDVGMQTSLRWLHEEERIESVIAEKLWRIVTGYTEENTVQILNILLRKIDVATNMRDPMVFQKYRDYVIKSTENANEFVDGIINVAKKVITEKFNDSFAIPDIVEGFQKKVFIVTWRGSFTADHGTILGLSTISRTGDTSFAIDNASLTHFYGNLYFQTLQLHYDRYKAEFMNIGSSGSLNTRLRPVRLHVHPYVNFETGKIYLEKFVIEDVGELVIEVTGLGAILNWIVSRIVTWVAGLARDKILDSLQTKYEEYIKSVLNDYTVDDFASGRAFGAGA